MANGNPVASEANLVRVRTPEGASLRPEGREGESIAAQPSPGLSQGERGIAAQPSPGLSLSAVPAQAGHRERFQLASAASLKQGVNRDD